MTYDDNFSMRTKNVRNLAHPIGSAALCNLDRCLKVFNISCKAEGTEMNVNN